MSTNSLDKYIKKMQKLRRGEKTAEGPAPHKPLLLLAVIDLIKQGEITQNKILVSPNLAETYRRHWLRVTDRTLNIAMPFYHLKGDKFWHLSPNQGKEEELESKLRIRSLKDLIELVDYAKLDSDLYDLLKIPENQEKISQTIIDTYFPDSKHKFQNLAKEEEQIGEWRQLLLEQVSEQPFSYETEEKANSEEHPVRNAAFRREIMRIYDYTCAICRLRIVTLDGESATDAAHIIPFNVSPHRDDVRNGISLCKLHHWAFDKGLISLSKTYKVIVSPLLSDSNPTEWMLTSQKDNSILLPEHNYSKFDILNPAKEALAWHREQILRQ